MIDGADPIETRVREAAMLREISKHVAEVEAAEERLRRSVREANAIGLSWAVIGGVLGMTRQGTRAKYAEGE